MAYDSFRLAGTRGDPGVRDAEIRAMKRQGKVPPIFDLAHGAFEPKVAAVATPAAGLTYCHIELSGFNLLYGASLRNLDTDVGEPAQILLRKNTLTTDIASDAMISLKNGYVSKYAMLEWTGILPLEGYWVVQAKCWHGTAVAHTLSVLAEKVDPGRGT